MRRALFLLCPIVLAVAVGCDEATLDGLPSEVRALVSSLDGLDLKVDLAAQNGEFGAGVQDRDRLMDGSCEGDGSHHQYNGATGGGDSGGNGDMLQLRDGSCGDGG